MRRKRLGPDALRDLHVYGGMLMVAVAASVVYAPAGPVVYGLFLAWLGLFWGGPRK